MNNGNIRWYSTICIKIVTVAILCCSIVLGGFSTYDAINEQKELNNDLHRLARITSQRLSRHLIGPMWDLDNDLVDSTLEAEMLEDKIQAIVVWDSDTKAVFSARERGAAGNLQVSSGAIAGDLIQSSSDVSNGERSIGEVAVFVSKKQLAQQLAHTTEFSVITMIALIITMAVVMTIMINQVIIGPISRLSGHVKAISHGDLKRNIEVESSDEIGQLAYAFHRMQKSLRVAFKRIYSKAKKS